MIGDWPELVPLNLVKRELRFSNGTLYPLVKQPDFPSIRVGNKFYVVKSEFIKWLEKETKKDKSTSNA